MRNILQEILHWYPPVGAFIAILALLGILVSLLRDVTQIKRREKALWSLVMLLLVGLEFRSLYLDRADHDQKEAAARAAQLRGFEKIGAGIEAAIQKSQEDFNATMSRFDTTTSTVTGGDSFCYLRPTFRGSKAQLALLQYGRYPLADVAMRIIDSDTFDSHVSEPQTMIGTLSVGGSRFITTVDMPNISEKKYVVTFTARNGAWDQFILLRHDAKGWHFATRVEENKGQVKFADLDKRTLKWQKVDPGFPGSIENTTWKTFNGIQVFCSDCK